MKKNKIVLVFIVLLASLFSCFVIINVLIKNNKKNICEFSYDQIISEINIITNSDFQKLNQTEMSRYMPIDLLDENDYVFCVDTVSDEYFAISKKNSEDKKNQLNNYVKVEKKRHNKIKKGENDIYTYVIKSPSSESTIEGIIRSYIYCEKEA